MPETIETVEDLAAAIESSGQATEAPETDAEQEEHPQAAAESPKEEADDTSEETEDTEDAGQADAPADDVVVKWKGADGAEIEAPIAELKAGYLRHADYTQKTQQLGEERKQAAEQVAQQLQKVQTFAHEQAQLINLQEQLALYQKADWNALYQQDPAEAGRLQAQWRQTEAKAQEVARSYQLKAQQFEADRVAEFQKRTQEARQALEREIPGFGQEQLKAMRETGRAHGFTDAELAQVADARTLKVLHEAAQWRALQAQKPVVQKKVQAAPTKATKPGAAGIPPSKRETAWKQLGARRDVDSLAAFLAASEN